MHPLNETLVLLSPLFAFAGLLVVRHCMGNGFGVFFPMGLAVKVVGIQERPPLMVSVSLWDFCHLSAFAHADASASFSLASYRVSLYPL